MLILPVEEESQSEEELVRCERKRGLAIRERRVLEPAISTHDFNPR
jgi:hypothetical protein